MVIKSVQKKEEGNLSKKTKSQAHPVKTEKLYHQPSKAAGRDLGQINPVSQLKAEAASPLPSSIRQRVEEASGLEIKGVKVHYHSSAPAQLQALAYTKGKDIYMGKGQEKYLSHEAWHVAQQMQGRVAPQFKIGGQLVNHDSSLEKEADTFAKGKSLHQTEAIRSEPVRTVGVAQGVLRIGLNPIAVSEKKIEEQNILSEADKEKAKVLIRDKKWHWYWSMNTLKKGLLKMPSSKNAAQNPVSDPVKVKESLLQQPFEQSEGAAGSATADKQVKKDTIVAASENLSKKEISHFEKYSEKAQSGKMGGYTAIDNISGEVEPPNQKVTKNTITKDESSNKSQMLDIAITDKQLRKNMRTAARENLSEQEIRYFKRYSAEAGPGKISEYTAMNNALRDAGPKNQKVSKSTIVKNKNSNKSQKLGSATFNLINSLSEAINRVPLPNSLTVYRGGGLYILGPDNVKKYENSLKPSPDKEKELVNSQIKEYGFMSTSIEKDVAEKFANASAKKPAAVCKINVPKGTKGVFLPTSFKDEKVEAERRIAGKSDKSIKKGRTRLTKFKNEKEVLFDKGKSIKLTAYSHKVTTAQGDTLYYEGQLV